MQRLLAAFSFCIAITACASTDAGSPESTFFGRASSLCGRAFAGRIVSNDRTDAQFAGERLVMHVRECSAQEIRIPFYIGDNRSRVWVLTREPDGLHLTHVHHHADGVEDVVSRYGGTSSSPEDAARQTFPADEASKALFAANNLPDSVANVWAIEVQPSRTFAYELSRPGRHFRVEFDLAHEVEAPAAPWGWR